MTNKKLGKILIKSGIIGMMSLTYAGCGIQSQKQAHDSAAENSTAKNSTDLKKGPTHSASLALALPASLPASVDQLEVTLSRLPSFIAAGQSVGSSHYREVTERVADFDPIYGISDDTVFTQIFQINDQTIQINDLEAGDYFISVNLIESNSGRTYSHGEGTANVQDGKDATVHISMTKVDATTGGLVIVLDDDSVPTPSPMPAPRPLPVEFCPAIAKLPVCVTWGKSLIYEVYEYKMDIPNSCNFLPLPTIFTQVPDSLCNGLPGYTRLRGTIGL